MKKKIKKANKIISKVKFVNKFFAVELAFAQAVIRVLKLRSKILI